MAYDILIMPTIKAVKGLVLANSRFKPYTYAAFRIQTFEGLNPRLATYLDNIKSEAPKGKAPPPAAKAPAGTTDTGAKAYGDAYKKAKDEIQKFVDGLSPAEIGFLSGIGFTAPGDDKKMRGDVVNTALAAWDMSASKYMKNAMGEGDAARGGLLQRLRDLDTALTSRGVTPVKPDQ